jgi:hypothetical protein
MPSLAAPRAFPTRLALAGVSLAFPAQGKTQTGISVVHSPIMLQASTTGGQMSPVQVEQVSPHFFPEQGDDAWRHAFCASMHLS